MKRILMLFFGCLAITAAACVGPGLRDALPTPAPAGFVGRIANALGPGTGAFGILDVLASLCAVFSVAAFVTMIFAPTLVAPKAAIGLALISAGTWGAKLLLVKYLWIMALLAAGGIIVATLMFLWGHRKWVEARLGVDLDKNGKVGE